MCLTLWALFLIVGLQFFTRYVLNDSLGWTEEVARMFLIVLTYVGAVVCAQRDSHIKVDLILDMLPPKLKALLVRSFDVVSAVFFLFLSWTAVRFANVTSLKMSSVPIPKSFLFWICAVALFLMAFHYLLHAIKNDGDSDVNENRNLGI
ncbi:TRAP transporter small permease [Loktanella sp. Alg231-35]|uniref:TRAP transporter small permease n=1 Tax=Loktanella sp. Alg231-35 TaxID=1922220 RepID=UPI001F3586EA|nr:TRAP transporter small permease [Loktanella sp. Alg231-35]